MQYKICHNKNTFLPCLIKPLVAASHCFGPFVSHLLLFHNFGPLLLENLFYTLWYLAVMLYNEWNLQISSIFHRFVIQKYTKTCNQQLEMLSILGNLLRNQFFGCPNVQFSLSKLFFSEYLSSSTFFPRKYSSPFGLPYKFFSGFPLFEIWVSCHFKKRGQNYTSTATWKHYGVKEKSFRMLPI